MSEAELEEQPGEQDKPKEETHEGFVSKEFHQKDVNKQFRIRKEAEEKLGKASERADIAEKALAEIREKQTDLTVPEVPDQYDEKYAEKIAARDVVIQQKAEHGVREQRLAEEKTRNDEVRAKEVEVESAAQVAVFDANMVALGVDIPAVKVAADKIIEYGVSEGLTDFILEDPEGPLMVQYLEQNPTELESMNQMSSLKLFNHINSTVRAKAALLKPKTSNAPNPPIVPAGGGVPEVEADWEKGAKYS